MCPYQTFCNVSELCPFEMHVEYAVYMCPGYTHWIEPTGSCCLY